MWGNLLKCLVLAVFPKTFTAADITLKELDKISNTRNTKPTPYLLDPFESDSPFREFSSSRTQNFSLHESKKPIYGYNDDFNLENDLYDTQMETKNYDYIDLPSTSHNNDIDLSIKENFNYDDSELDQAFPPEEYYDTNHNDESYSAMDDHSSPKEYYDTNHNDESYSAMDDHSSPKEYYDTNHNDESYSAMDDHPSSKEYDYINSHDSSIPALNESLQSIEDDPDLYYDSYSSSESQLDEFDYSISKSNSSKADSSVEDSDSPKGKSLTASQFSNSYNSFNQKNTKEASSFSCKGRTGYFSDLDRDSAFFHFCSNTGRIFTYKCGENLFFDEIAVACKPRNKKESNKTILPSPSLPRTPKKEISVHKFKKPAHFDSVNKKQPSVLPTKKNNPRNKHTNLAVIIENESEAPDLTRANREANFRRNTILHPVIPPPHSNTFSRSPSPPIRINTNGFSNNYQPPVYVPKKESKSSNKRPPPPPAPRSSLSIVKHKPPNSPRSISHRQILSHNILRGNNRLHGNSALHSLSPISLASHSSRYGHRNTIIPPHNNLNSQLHGNFHLSNMFLGNAIVDPTAIRPGLTNRAPLRNIPHNNIRHSAPRHHPLSTNQFVYGIPQSVISTGKLPAITHQRGQISNSNRFPSSSIISKPQSLQHGHTNFGVTGRFPVHSHDSIHHLSSPSHVRRPISSLNQNLNSHGIQTHGHQYPISIRANYPLTTGTLSHPHNSIRPDLVSFNSLGSLNSLNTRGSRPQFNFNRVQTNNHVRHPPNTLNINPFSSSSNGLNGIQNNRFTPISNTNIGQHQQISPHLLNPSNSLANPIQGDRFTPLNNLNIRNQHALNPQFLNPTISVNNDRFTPISSNNLGHQHTVNRHPLIQATNFGNPIQNNIINPSNNRHHHTLNRNPLVSSTDLRRPLQNNIFSPITSNDIRQHQNINNNAFNPTRITNTAPNDRFTPITSNNIRSQNKLRLQTINSKNKPASHRIRQQFIANSGFNVVSPGRQPTIGNSHQRGRPSGLQTHSKRPLHGTSPLFKDYEYEYYDDEEYDDDYEYYDDEKETPPTRKPNDSNLNKRKRIESPITKIPPIRTNQHRPTNRRPPIEKETVTDHIDETTSFPITTRRPKLKRRQRVKPTERNNLPTRDRTQKRKRPANRQIRTTKRPQIITAAPEDEILNNSPIPSPPTTQKPRKKAKPGRKRFSIRNRLNRLKNKDNNSKPKSSFPSRLDNDKRGKINDPEEEKETKFKRKLKRRKPRVDNPKIDQDLENSEAPAESKSEELPNEDSKDTLSSNKEEDVTTKERPKLLDKKIRPKFAKFIKNRRERLRNKAKNKNDAENDESESDN